MTEEQLIEQLRTAPNVTIWNATRRMLLPLIGTKAFSELDSSGMCVKVLGKKQRKPKTRHYDNSGN